MATTTLFCDDVFELGSEEVSGGGRIEEGRFELSESLRPQFLRLKDLPSDSDHNYTDADLEK